MEPTLCFIRESYFKNNALIVKLLDEEMTTEELNVELEKGYADMVEGRTVSVKQAFANIRKEHNI